MSANGVGAFRPMFPLNAGEAERKKRREDLARELLLKLVESTPGAIKYDTKFNVAKALEYTDALLAQLDKGERDGTTDK